MTPNWPENVSAQSLEQIFVMQAENRAWNKILRARATNLVNTRLAKTISMEDYTASRQSASSEAVGSSRVDLQACKLEYSIVSPK